MINNKKNKNSPKAMKLNADADASADKPSDNKALIFDSSSIITLAMNNLLYILKPLKEKFGGKFFITSDVKKEVVDRPLQIKRFELEALMIKSLIKEGILQVFPVEEKETRKVLDYANNLLKSDDKFIEILHSGEASCIALSRTMEGSTLVVDERTTRMLCEAPENLQKLMEKKLHTRIEMNTLNLGYFRDIGIIRSSELVFAAYAKGIIQLPADAPQALDALLFATKFKGNSISFSEIEEAKRYYGEL